MRVRPGSRAATLTRVLPVLAVIVTLLLLGVSLAMKEHCAATVVGGVVRQATAKTQAQTLCYSDVQWLWWSRGLGQHIFPYIGGRIIPPFALSPAEFDYPVLTGLFAWLSALASRTDAQFLAITVLMLAPFAAATSVLLTLIAPGRSWMWWLAPSLVLYSAYNWDILPVTCVVVAAFLVERARARSSTSLAPVVIAAAVLGIGGALKLYPLLFLAPLVLFVLLPANGPRRWARALAVAGSGIGAFVVCNLPFALADFRGWLAPYIYQSARLIDRSTLSIWYFAFRQFGDPARASEQTLMSALATASTVIALVLALAIGLVRARNGGAYPWLQVSAAMLCAYMVLNKVDSPQYILWLLPFFVLLRLPWPWVIAYWIADILVIVGFFDAAYFDTLGRQHTWASPALAAGVFGRAGLLALFFVLFLRARSSVDSGRSTLTEARSNVTVRRPQADVDELTPPIQAGANQYSVNHSSSWWAEFSACSRRALPLRPKKSW